MAAGDLAICIIVFWFSKKRRIPGSCAVLYLFLYSVGRFIIEFFRNDPRGNVGVLSTSQFIAIIIAVIDGGCLYYLLKVKSGKAGDTVMSDENTSDAENKAVDESNI